MKYKECFLNWCWSHTLSIILREFSSLQTAGSFKNQKNKICPYNSITTGKYITKYKFRTFGASQALRAQPSSEPGLHVTYLNTLSSQTPRGQELLGHIKKAKIGKSKLWLRFSSSLMKRVLNFMHNPKRVYSCFFLTSKHIFQLDECFNLKKSKPKSDKVETKQTNEQTNDHLFCQK